jgi:signal transduction histidine kinase
MHSLIEDYVARTTRILDVARIAAGEVVLVPEVVDLSAVVARVVRRQCTAAAHAGGRIAADLEPGITGVWDPRAIEQMAGGLLASAIRMSDGQPVSVGLRQTRAAVCLTTSSRGAAPDDAGSAGLFGRFEHAVQAHRHNGFGIDLWIAGRLADAMGGRVAMASHPGEGATVTVTLPVPQNVPERSSA